MYVVQYEYTGKRLECFIVLPPDKNIDPTIIERSAYIKRALNGHLFDENTRLTPL
jgi:hypothetical protein